MSPMVVVFSGMFAEAKDGHHMKAPEPMVLTVAGMVTEVSERVKLKEWSPMEVTGFSSMMLGMMRSPPGP